MYRNGFSYKKRWSQDGGQEKFGSQQAGGFGEAWGGCKCEGSRQRGDSCGYEDPFWEAEWALVSEMNLSRHLLIRLLELEGQPVDMARFGLVLRWVGRSGKGGASSERSPRLQCS